MNTKQPRWRWFKAAAIPGILILLVFLAILLRNKGEVGQVRLLPNGSTLELRQVGVMTTKDYLYSHWNGGKLVRFFGNIVPPDLMHRLGFSRSVMGFRSDGSTNLIVVTVNHHALNSSADLSRMQVFDDLGDVYDSNWGANTLGSRNETVRGRQVPAFPRRSRMLGLRFLGTNSGEATNQPVAFQVPNPLFQKYPQWTPEPWPAAKSDGDLEVKLEEFQSGERGSGRWGLGSEAIAARKTRIRVSFAEQGKSSEDWRVQKLKMSDATGNAWDPYLDLIKQEFGWATNGTVECFGALWPGENAWKLDLDLIRTAGFKPEELWKTSLSLPARGTVTSPTNRWSSDSLTLSHASLAGPNAEHSGDFKWIGKWWGEDRDNVYSLIVQADADLNGRWLSVVDFVDQNGKRVELMQHSSQGSKSQAIMFKPSPEATDVRLTLALQRGRHVQFLARPQFVGEKAGSTKVDGLMK